MNWDISGLVSADDIVANWYDDSPHSHLVLHLVAPADQTEPIMEQKERRYGSTPDFRGITIPIEGVWPSCYSFLNLVFAWRQVHHSCCLHSQYHLHQSRWAVKFLPKRFF